MDCTHASYPSFPSGTLYVFMPHMCTSKGSIFRGTHVRSGLCSTSCIATVFKETGQRSVLSSSKLRLPFEGLTNDSCSLVGPSLGLCAKHYTGGCWRGEVATAAAIEVWEEWRPRIRVFKHHCPVHALIWLHLGTGCSVPRQLPSAHERHSAVSATTTAEWARNLKCKTPSLGWI